MKVFLILHKKILTVCGEGVVVFSSQVKNEGQKDSPAPSLQIYRASNQANQLGEEKAGACSKWKAVDC